jgi:hypothetical protein
MDMFIPAAINKPAGFVLSGQDLADAVRITYGLPKVIADRVGERLIYNMKAMDPPNLAIDFQSTLSTGIDEAWSYPCRKTKEEAKE